MIAKPVAGTVRIAVDGVEQDEGAGFEVDAATGMVTFLAGHVPGTRAEVTAGYEFDVPVRFDTDFLDVNLAGFAGGEIPAVPLVEVRG